MASHNVKATTSALNGTQVINDTSNHFDLGLHIFRSLQKAIRGGG